MGKYVYGNVPGDNLRLSVIKSLTCTVVILRLHLSVLYHLKLNHSEPILSKELDT